MSDPTSTGPADDVARALALLARRADAAPAADRLVRVHRRARRAAQRRTAGLVAALVLAVGGAGLAVDRGIGADRGSGPSVTPTSSGLDVRLEPETDPVVLAAAQSGRYDGTGTRFVVLRLRVTGQAPGGVVGLRLEQPGLGYSGTGDLDCPPGRDLLPVNLDELETLTYAAGSPATARVVVTVTACDPVGAVTREITVTVPPAPTPTG